MGATTRSSNTGQDNLARAHKESVRLDFSDIVGFLKEHLGNGAVSIIAGSVDAKTINRWAATKDASPRDHEVERRLRTAYQVFHLIQQEEAPQTIRAWFLGMNPQLEDQAPVSALANGQDRAVLSAARAFVAGG